MTRRSGLIDQTVALLRTEITAGRWPVGSKIPPEPALVAQLNVGRNTVREAVQALVHAGLLERRQGSGTFVLSDSELTVVLGRQIAAVSQREVLEVRRSLELEIARLAAANRTTAQIRTIESLNNARQAAFAGDNLDDMTDTDLALHRAIAAASRNAMLIGLYDHLLDAISENIRYNVMNEHGRHDHDALVEAVIAGDQQQAMQEVEAYLANLITPIS